MATVSTEHIEIPLATSTHQRRSRWRVALDVLIVPLCFYSLVLAVTDLLDGNYLQGIESATRAIAMGVSLYSLIVGRNFEQDFVKHPWFAFAFYSLLISGTIAGVLRHVRENDQRRAVAFQARVQATQLVKGTQ